MDKDRITALVAREVMKKMEESSTEDAGVSSDRQLLVILNHPDRRIFDLLKLIGRLVGTKEKLTLAISDEVMSYFSKVGEEPSLYAKNIIVEKELFMAIHDIEEFTTIIVPILRPSFISGLLAIDDKDRFVDIVHQGMMAKAEVILLKDTLVPSPERRNSIPVAIRSKVEGQLKAIRSMNLLVTDSKGLEKMIGGGESKALKRLITEKDILALGHSTKLLSVDPGTIITPSARDKAKERGIRII